MKQQRYIIRKFVLASSLQEAIELWKKWNVDEVFIDPTYQQKRKQSQLDIN